MKHCTEKVEDHSLPVEFISRLWSYWEIINPLTLCIHEWKWVTEMKVGCTHFLLFIEMTYVENTRWNRAWHHSQAKDNSIEHWARWARKFTVLLTTCWPRVVCISCVMLPDREHSFVATHILLVMQWDDCSAVKGAVHLLAVSHGIGWDKPIQHNSRTHPLAHEIRYCLDTKIATPLTSYLLWYKIRLSCKRKFSNTYILQDMS